MNYLNKENLLLNVLKNYGSAAIAFSGGVDSSFLLAFAKKVFKKNIIAVTSSCAIHAEKELNFAKKFGKRLLMKHSNSVKEQKRRRYIYPFLLKIF